MTKAFWTFAVALCALGELPGSAAAATTYAWKGGGTDANWSTAENWEPSGTPGKNDTVTFDAGAPDATVDADFAGQVYKVTVASGYTGTITLGRALVVGYELNIAGGAFTCGANDLQLGDPSDASKWPGRFFLSGGTFNGPTGAATLCQKAPTYASCYWKISGGAFNVSDTTFSIWLKHDVNYTSQFYIDGQTFKSVRFEDVLPTGTCRSAPRIKWIGTNTVTGAFMHRYGTCWDVGDKMWFNVHGDYYTGGNGSGGPGVACLCGTGDQKVIGDEKGRPSLSLWVDKPSGKVTFEGGKVVIGWGESNSTRGERFISATTIDMSALDTFEACGSGGAALFIYPCVNLLAPTNFVFRNKQWGVFNVRDQTFRNLSFICEEYAINWANPCTNTINGTLFTDGYVTFTKRSEFYNSNSPGVAFVNGDMILSNRVGNAGGMLPHLFTNSSDQVIHLRGGSRRPCLPKMYIRKPTGSRLTVVADDGDDVVRGGVTDGGNDYVFSLESGTLDLSAFKTFRCMNGYNTVLQQKGGELIDPGITWVLDRGCINPGIGPFPHPIHAVRNEYNGNLAARGGTLTVTGRVELCGGSDCHLSGQPYETFKVITSYRASRM